MNLSHLFPQRLASVVLLALFAASIPLCAQNSVVKRRLITQPVDESALVTLTGNTRPEARAANDRGPVADDLQLRHMYLQMNRAPELQQEMDTLVNELHDKNAPEYHHWLTAAEIAERFGPAEEDIQTVKGWLESHGFSVNVVYRQNGVLDFSGPASSIREAFHTEIHNLSVKGEAHIANMSDPKIPAALAPAVVGVVSLHDFPPRRAVRPRPQYTFIWNSPWGPLQEFGVVPDDLSTIYNFAPLYAQGITGRGQTIVALEDTDLYTTQDWYTFRSTFGLAKRFPYGSLQQIHPQPSGNDGATCAAPGVNSDDSEAAIDVEWASAAAPDADIILAACASTNTTFGGYFALQNLFTGPSRPPEIFTLSYIYAEVWDGQAANLYISGLYEIGVLQGVSIFVAAGDNGAAESDYYESAEQGISVNAFASTPFNVAVGGTDFADYYFNEISSYWSATNGRYYNSALSYVPETTWNQSCASPLLSSYNGYPTPYGANGYCNSPNGEEYATAQDGTGGGGPSGCAYGAPSIVLPPGATTQSPDAYAAVVSGTCRGYVKPLYQQFVYGNPKDTVRDLPDVAMFTGAGTWAHYYIVCYSDPAYEYNAPCVGPPSDWSGFGGTSVASPIMAGVQALVNQATGGGYQGNPNYVLYALGTLQYDLGGASACNATLGNQVNPSCIFHDVTLGTTSVDCVPLTNNDNQVVGTFNCYIPSGMIGVLSLSKSSYEPAYPATPGWDFATGLGSVNVTNLVRAWPGTNVH